MGARPDCVPSTVEAVAILGSLFSFPTGRRTVTATLQFILVIGILILCARLGGALSRRLNQPAVLGELVAKCLYC